MESMACGVPVIATRWSAHLEFMHDENSYLVDIDGLEPADADDVPNYRGQRWAVPRTAHLTQLLRQAHEDRAGRAALGARAREEMCADWTWRRGAEAIMARLREIGESTTFASPRLPARHRVAHPAVTPDIEIEGVLFDRACFPSVTERLITSCLTRLGERAAVRNRAANTRRPSRGLAETAAWDAAKREVREDDRTVRVTVVDGRARSGERLPRPPRTGCWIVALCPSTPVSGALARTLRDQADAVWVPTEATRAAVVSLGVPAARIRLVPPPPLFDRLDARGAVKQYAVSAPRMLLTGLFDASEGPALLELVRTFARRNRGDGGLGLRLLLPPTTDRPTAAWRAHLLALHDAGRLGAGQLVTVDSRLPDLDDLGTILRAHRAWVDVTPSGPPPIIAAVAAAVGVPRTTVDRAGDVGRDASSERDAEHDGNHASGRDAIDAYEAAVDAAIADLVLLAETAAPRAALRRDDTIDVSRRPGSALTIFAHADWRDGTAAAIAHALSRFPLPAGTTLRLALDPAQGVDIDEVRRVLAEAAAPAGERELHIGLEERWLTPALRAALAAEADLVIALDDQPLATFARSVGAAVATSLTPRALATAVRAARPDITSPVSAPIAPAMSTTDVIAVRDPSGATGHGASV